jgi:hypothetical protein
VKDLTGRGLLSINQRPIQSESPLPPDSCLAFTANGPKFQFLGEGRLAEIETTEVKQTSTSVNRQRAAKPGVSRSNTSRKKTIWPLLVILVFGAAVAGLYFLKPAKKGFLKPVGEWNRETITVNGPHVTVVLNGTVINEADLDELARTHPAHQGVKRRSGHITFCGHGDPVQFRNIRIKELPGVKKSATQLKSTGISENLPPMKAGKAEEIAGFKPVYNGKDLSGWKQDPGHVGHWQARGAVLHYDGKSTAKDKNLWTEQSYGDFVLRCDWRWAEKAHQKRLRPVLDPATGETKKGPDGKPMMVKVDELDSGIYLRGNSKSQVNIWNWSCGSGEVYGYRTKKKYPQAIRSALTPSVNADKLIGEWNRFVITMKGDRLTVELNGQVVIKNAQLPGVPKSGPLALQHHGSAIEFANIMIKSL